MDLGSKKYFRSNGCIRDIPLKNTPLRKYLSLLGGGGGILIWRFFGTGKTPQKNLAASRRKGPKINGLSCFRLLLGAARRPGKKITFLLPSRIDFLHFKSDLDPQNDTFSLQKVMYILKIFRLRRAKYLKNSI